MDAVRSGGLPMVRTSLRFAPAALFILSISAYDARAIPAFARKYETSCMTCHTVYPKLTPFGEAFRRNGFRFPGTDSDYWKQETVALQPKTSSGEGATLTAIPPLSFGANGDAVIHPDKTASAAVADNSTRFSLADLVAEG